MDFASNVIYTARGTPILFGQTPHTSSAYDQILEWLGPTGRIVDLRTDKERRTPSQAHGSTPKASERSSMIVGAVSADWSRIVFRTNRNVRVPE